MLELTQEKRHSKKIGKLQNQEEEHLYVFCLMKVWFVENIICMVLPKFA